MFKKFLFVFFLSIFVFVFACSAYASGNVVSGLTYNIPESPEYPNHTYILIYRRETGNPTTSGIFMLKYYIPIVFNVQSNSTMLRCDYVNGLHYRYDPSTDTFVQPIPGLRDDYILGTFRDAEGNSVRYDDPNAVQGIFILASNHNIYLNDGTLFFWTIQQNTESPYLYREVVTEMVKTLLTVGGKTLGVALMIFGIVLGVLWVKRWIFLFLR